MFEEGQGPAGFLIDSVQRRWPEDPGMYKINDRSSPRAERMLEHYSIYAWYEEDRNSLEYSEDSDKPHNFKKRCWAKSFKSSLRDILTIGWKLWSFIRVSTH
ncbi:hypothetical protein DPSP01_007368 [Paraphaeosphaeria sporulosa]